MQRTPKVLIYKATCSDVPMFNQTVYTSKTPNDSTSLGKIDEILGPVKDFMFTVIPKDGIQTGSVKDETKIYLDKNFFLPMTTFTNPKTKRISKGRGRGRGRGRGMSRGSGNSRGRGFSRSFGGGSSRGRGGGFRRGGYRPRGRN